MKLFETVEEMEAIPKIRRPRSEAHHGPDRRAGAASSAGRSASPWRDLVGAQCGAVIGLSPAGRRVALGQAHGRRLVQDAWRTRAAHQHAMDCVPYGRYAAMAVSPLTSGRLDPPDICLIYGTPGQMIFFINGLQWTGYKKFVVHLGGRVGVRRLVGQGAEDRRARADDPVLRRAALRRRGGRRAADGDARRGFLPSVIEGLAALSQERAPLSGPALRHPERRGGRSGGELTPEKEALVGSDAAARARDVHAAYGRRRVLHGVRLTARAGEVVSLLGRNGAGKSTTLKAVVGPGGGHRRRRSARRPRRARAAHPRDQPAGRGLGAGRPAHLRRPHRARRTCRSAKRARPAARAWAAERVFALLPEARASSRASAAGSLSGGEQQMLTVARTLMSGPRLLLLDEPSEGLAPVVVRALADNIAALKREGLTILLSEQNLAFAARLADRAYIIEKGEIRFEGPFAAARRASRRSRARA